MPELEHRKEVLKKLRQQFEPIDLKQIARDWEENHPTNIAGSRKKPKSDANVTGHQVGAVFSGMPSIYRLVLVFMCSWMMLRASYGLQRTCIHEGDRRKTSSQAGEAQRAPESIR
jgi:hypothetical protein